MNEAPKSCPKCGNDLTDAIEVGETRCPRCGFDLTEGAPRGSRKGRLTAIALASLLVPALISSLALWAINEDIAFVVTLAGSAIAGLFAGIVLSMAFARSVVTRILVAVVICPLCAVSSLMLSVLGCNIVR